MWYNRFATILHTHTRGANSLQHNDNTAATGRQVQILHDYDNRGKERPWALHRTEADYMAYAYDEIKPDKASKIRGCATWVEFARAEGADSMQLHDANFCRIRLCPVCQWRRSLKIWSQTSDLVAAAKNQGNYSWIMLTLTQRNVDGWELKYELDRLYKAWSDLTRRKQFKAAIKGWMRVLEVTHNTKLGSNAFDTFHPHFHALLCVNASYFHSRDYISQKEWASLWADCMGLDYTPSVDVHAIKGDTAGAIAEVSKYATKPDSVLTPEDWDLTVRTIEQLDADLANRRLIAYGGILRKLHHDLHMDSIDDGDLIHTSNDDEVAAAVYEYVSYSWNIGYRAYCKASTREGGAPDEDKRNRHTAARGTAPREQSAQ